MPARALILASLLGACGDNLPGPYVDPPSVEVVSMPAMPSKQLDVLLVIDDSPGTADFQVALGAGFDALLDRLGGAAGASFDLHLGVTTSDYGTTALADPDHPGPPLGQIGNGGCMGAGKDGALITSGAAVTGDYLKDSLGGRNFTGSRHDVLAQMFEVGAGGCGFEQPLSAMQRALSSQQITGFHRPGANLLVLAIQDEDDCSLADPALLGPESAALGPLQSFRCTQFGVQCDEDLATIGDKHHCTASVGSRYVTDVAPYAAVLTSLVGDPSRVTFGVIAGVPEPFAVALVQPPGGGTAIPALTHSCGYPAAGFPADPPVRMQSLVQEMGAHGVMSSICADDLRPSLGEIARVADQMFGVACLDSSVLRDSSTEPGIQPECVATEVRDGVETELLRCPGHGGDCFDLIADEIACPATPDRLRFVVNFTTPPTLTTYIRARCEVP